MLGFYISIHQDKVIKVHPSMTTGFAMDFDGDEGNITLPYTPTAIDEIEKIVLCTHNMVSLGSSSLLIGYHQDVNIAAYILSLPGTYLSEEMFTYMAELAYEYGSRDGLITIPYDEWMDDHKRRCRLHNVEIRSGRSAYSLLIPRDLNWKHGNRRIVDGILVSGILGQKSCSGDPSSIGMRIHGTRGAHTTINWLDVSYQVLGRYLQRYGVTLGISDIDIPDEEFIEIQRVIDKALSETPREEDMGDVVLNNRREQDIITHLGNIRDSVGVIVLGNKDPKKEKVEKLILYINHTTYDELEIPITFPRGSMSRDEDVVTITDGRCTINTQEGWISWTRGDESYTWPFYIFRRVVFNKKEYRHHVSPLKAMIESGARGNSVSATQIAGNIGSLTYSGGRLPRMMGDGYNPNNMDGDYGKRSMPTYPFGDNSPQSRGFISSSYLQGMTQSDYMAAHVASRENMSANTSLTPDTGYFGRRVRVFLENIQVDYVHERQCVVDERGVIVTMDYILKSDKVFAIDGKFTFVDVEYEMSRINEMKFNTKALYVSIPYRESYLVYDDWLSSLRNVDRDIIISIDPRTDQDYYEYLRDYLPKEIHRTVYVIRSRSFLGFTEYDDILVVPIGRNPVISAHLEEGVSARIGDVNMRPVPSVSDIFPLLIGAVNIEDVTYMVRPDTRYLDLTKTHTLVESMLLLGRILPL